MWVLAKRQDLLKKQTDIVLDIAQVVRQADDLTKKCHDVQAELQVVKMDIDKVKKELVARELEERKKKEEKKMDLNK